MRLTTARLQTFLIYAFVFLGPLGTLLTPSFFPYAFRFYYFLLPLFPFLFLKIEVKQWKTIVAFVPYLAYCLISSYFTHYKDEVAHDAYPLFRAFLFISQCLFMFGAAIHLRRADQIKEKQKLTAVYLSGFFLSLFIGYLFFIGYYTGHISFQTLQKYSVETQIGWGILRLSPGSYPNEYGNVCSFVLSTLLLMYAKKRRFWVFLVMGLTFLALLLTTTRAAFLSCLVTIFYLLITEKVIRRLMLKISLFLFSLLLVLKAYSIDFFKIFVAGVKTISLTYGSTGIRVEGWLEGLKELNTHVFLGNGFGANMRVHNVYSILLFELGLIGSLLLSVTFLYYFSQNTLRLKDILFKRTFAHQMTVIGLIHILLFAVTNHNMNHHLTWFVFLVFNMTLFAESPEELEAHPTAPSNTQQPHPLA